jgi:hypothetical protein
MKGRLIAFIIIIAIAFAGCRKNNSTIQSTVPCIPNKKIWGSFTIDQNFSVTNNSVTLSGRFPLIYISSGDGCAKAPAGVYPGPVQFNSKYLNLQSPNFWAYINENDTASQNEQPPFNWTISGSNEFPSFSESVPDSIPEFFKSQFLPDTLSKSGSTQLQLSGKNANEIIITVTSGFSHSISIPASSTSFAVTMPSNIYGNTNGTLMVSYQKSYSKSIQGVNLIFNTRASYNKTVFIKN